MPRPHGNTAECSLTRCHYRMSCVPSWARQGRAYQSVTWYRQTPPRSCTTPGNRTPSICRRILNSLLLFAFFGDEQTRIRNIRSNFPHLCTSPSFYSITPPAFQSSPRHLTSASRKQPSTTTLSLAPSQIEIRASTNNRLKGPVPLWTNYSVRPAVPFRLTAAAQKPCLTAPSTNSINFRLR